MFRRIVVLTALMTFSASVLWAADALDKSRQIITQTNKNLQSSQKRIDQADDEIMRMLGEYKAAQKEIDNYLVYNGQLKEIVDSQMEEMRLLEGDIDKIEATGLQIMPFMQKMIDGLARFITSDYPFLPAERKERIERLNANMKRADLSIAAKYRQILEAYQIEIDYGNTLEAYEGNLEDRKVNFLKIGRIGLYYLRLDKEKCGAWDPVKKQWQELNDIDYTVSIDKAIRIAKKQRSPDLFFAAVASAKERK